MPDPAYDGWVVGDFLKMTSYLPNGEGLDLVIGNPPYSLAEPFVRKAMSMLKNDGHLLMLMRVEFLASQGRANGLFKEFPPFNVYVCSRRISFQTDGKTAAHQEYVMVEWEKGWSMRPELAWWDYQRGIIQ
jgi:hypothetical protein